MFLQLLILLVIIVLLLSGEWTRVERFVFKTDTFPYHIKDFRTLTKSAFIKCIQGDVPVLFQHAFDTKAFPAFTHLCNTFPNWPIQVRYGSYKTPSGRASRKFKTLTIREYCKHKHQYYGGNNRISAAQIHRLGVQPTASFLHHFPNGKLWIGTKGSRTPLHKDEPYNLSLQLFGHKQWTFFHRKDVRNLCYDKLNTKLEWSRYTLGDIATCPRAKQAKKYVITVSPGEMLYLPTQWSHDVSNLNDSVMVNFWFPRVSNLLEHTSQSCDKPSSRATLPRGS